MREGLKNNTLGTLLFPRDPIRNAPEIIAQPGDDLPGAPRAATCSACWRRSAGSRPTLVLLELALILEFGERCAADRARPHQLACCRRASNDLVRLNLDALGLIDFDEGTASSRRRAGRFAAGAASSCSPAAWRCARASAPGRAPASCSRWAASTRASRRRRACRSSSASRSRSPSGDNPRLTCEAYFAHHVEHHAVRRAGAAVCRGVRLQRRGRRRLRRADPARAVPLHRRLPRLGPAQARLAQPVQGVGRRRARRAAPAARQRQGVVRDLLVRLLGPLRQDADRRREAAAAAGGRRARPSSSARSPTARQLERARRRTGSTA